MIASERSREGSNIDKLDEKIAASIVNWMRTCMTLLDKEKSGNMKELEF
jgi:hypothetical protein